MGVSGSCNDPGTFRQPNTEPQKGTPPSGPQEQCFLSANEIKQVCNDLSLELKLWGAATYKYHGYTSYETCNYIVLPTISYLYLEILLRRGHVEP